MSEVVKKESEGGAIPVSRRYPSPSLTELDRWFDNMLPRMWAPYTRVFEADMRVPKIDIIDEKDQVRVHVEAPGVKKEDLDVSIDDHAVTIKGKTHRREESKEANYHRCEIEQGEFSRTVSLPSEVDGSKAKAKLQDGVLELTIPKMEQSKRRSIKID